jgi:hypothetical protein
MVILCFALLQVPVYLLLEMLHRVRPAFDAVAISCDVRTYCPAVAAMLSGQWPCGGFSFGRR